MQQRPLDPAQIGWSADKKADGSCYVHNTSCPPRDKSRDIPITQPRENCARNVRVGLESGLVRHGLYHEGYVMGDKLNEVLSLHGKKTCTTYGTRTSVRSSRSRKQLVSAHSEATNSSFSTSIDGTGAEEKKDNPAWASSNESKVFIKIFTFMITLL